MSQTSRIPPAAPRSSAKPAHTPRRQSPGSKLPTPRRKDAHYKEDKVEDKVRGSSLERYMAARCPVPPGIGLSVWQSQSASLSSAWAALALRWLATHEPHIRLYNPLHPPSLCFSHRRRPARPSGVSATGDAPVRMLDRARLGARPLAWVLRPGGAPQAAQSARRRASTPDPNERWVSPRSHGTQSRRTESQRRKT